MPHPRLHVRQAEAWPPLPYEDWRETCATLHMWTQIVGKVRLTLSPPLNHWWHAPLYLSARGLTTSLIPLERGALQIDFDFFDHSIVVLVSDGRQRRLSLPGRSVAGLYRELLSTLRSLGVPTDIRPLPAAVADPLPFPEDNRNTYDGAFVQRFWHILLQVDHVLQEFQSRYVGKSSPVQFHWSRFDLALSRYSGRLAEPDRSPADVPLSVLRESYSHEVFTAGFWPGNGGLGEPAFYLEAHPEPPDFARTGLHPEAAHYDAATNRVVLPYAALRAADNPSAALLEFLQSGYDAVAGLGNWDRNVLERNPDLT